jgi:hypothetical protein
MAGEITENNMSEQYNFGQSGTMSPEMFAQQQELNRQQRMAQMLMQQGQQQPQGQMISGRYVAPSIFQNLAALANTAAGTYLQSKGDEKALDLAKQLREEGKLETQRLMNAWGGTPASEKTTELAGPYTGNVPAPVATQTIPAQPGSAKLALSEAINMNSPQARALIPQLMKEAFKEPKWEKSERIVNGVRETGYVDLISANPPATFRLAGSSPDIDTAKGIYEGYLPAAGSQGYGQGGGQNVPVSVRNNNPGNLVGNNGQFLSFATPQQGEAALVNDLSLKLSGQSPAYKARFGNAPVTPATLAETWSPATAQGNSPESTTNYGKAIAPIPNTPEALQKVKSAITRFEAGAYGGQQADKYAPSSIPQYQNDPTISPKQNAEARAAFNKENQTAIKNAKNSFDLLKETANILNTGAPSSGRGENIITGTREFFGGGGATSKADAQLKIFGSKLTSQVPRFEGPQSDKDTALYQAAAGDVANPNIPIASRLAAIETMKTINQKYYPNGDCDSIDVSGPVTTRQTFLKGSSTVDPAQFVQGLNAQDKEAFTWARKNPSDPRAAKINERLGIQ